MKIVLISVSILLITLGVKQIKKNIKKKKKIKQKTCFTIKQKEKLKKELIVYEIIKDKTFNTQNTIKNKNTFLKLIEARQIDQVMFILDIINLLDDGTFFKKAWNETLKKYLKNKIYPQNIHDNIKELKIICEYTNKLGSETTTILTNIAKSLEEKEKLKSETKIALAPAKTTIKLLSTLPALALGTGYAMGINPIHILFKTSSGNICLTLGIIFYISGQIWVKKLLEKTKTTKHL